MQTLERPTVTIDLRADEQQHDEGDVIRVPVGEHGRTLRVVKRLPVAHGWRYECEEAE